jgi:hypothetical protein
MATTSKSGLDVFVAESDVSATPALPATKATSSVQNPCPKSTSHNHRCQRVVRRSRHGTPARLCSRLHHRPAPPAPGRRPHCCRLLSGVHRDRQRCPPRPPDPRAAPGPAAARRHPGRLETRPARPLPAASGRHRHRPGRPRDRVPEPPEAIDTTTPGGKLVFHVFAALAEFERDLIRERTAAGLAAARARGRQGGRPRY